MAEDADSKGASGGAAGEAAELVARLDLAPHREGGYFREVYRAAARVSTGRGERPLSTAILYLVTEEAPSRFHRLASDELWFYHTGAALEMVLLHPRVEEGPAKVEQVILDANLPQVLIPAGCWMAARVLPGPYADWGTGRVPERRWRPDRRSRPVPTWTLVSCVVSPGFEYEDLELAQRDALLRDYPEARELILALT